MLGHHHFIIAAEAKKEFCFCCYYFLYILVKIEQVQKILYTVKGHKGRFVFGYVEETPVVIMQGRVHYYEGYDMTDVVLPTRLMGMMGAKKILLTNAAGISKGELNHKEVQETADKVAKSFKELVAKVVVNM